MPRYIVYAPITMNLAIELEAGSEEEARDAAFQTDYRFIIEKGEKEEAEFDIIEVEMHKHVTRGSVFSGVLNDMEIEELEDDDDED